MKSKMLKSIVAALLSATMLVSFVACGESDSEEDKNNDSAEASASDSADVNNNTNNDKEINIANAQVGDYITFGEYEQDGYTNNGAEDIEWLVLDVKDGKALVISKYALDCKQYNEDCVDVTWETCTLRTWLNNEFYNTAFSNSEKNKISTTTVVAEDNPEYRTEAGNDTQDKVFLLSISETNKYFGSDDERMCEPTQYTINNGVFEYMPSYKGKCCWWLRSPGGSEEHVSYIDGSGLACSLGEGSDFNHANRPAMWITLD